MSGKTAGYLFFTVLMIALPIVGLVMQPGKKSPAVVPEARNGSVAEPVAPSVESPAAAQAAAPVTIAAAPSQANPGIPATVATSRAAPTSRALRPKVQPVRPPPDPALAWKQLSPDGNLHRQRKATLPRPLDLPTYVNVPTATFEGHTGAVGAIRFSPDNKTVASGATDGEVKIWDVATGKAVKTISGARFPIFSLAYTSDGKRLAVGEVGGMVRVYEVATAKQVAAFMAHSGNVHQVEFLQDNRRLASGGCDGVLRIWDTATGKGLKEFGLHDRCIEGLSVNKLGTVAITGSEDLTATIVNLETGKVDRFLGRAIINSVGWGANDLSAFIFVGRGMLQTVDIATKKVKAEYLVYEEDSQRTGGMADRSLAAVADGVEVGIFSPSDGYSLAMLRGATQLIRALDMSPDGTMVAAAGAPRPIYLPQDDGDPDSRVYFWNIKAAGLKPLATRTSSVGATADGKIAAVGRDDGSIRLMEVAGQKLLGELRGPAGAVASVRFNAEGTVLAAVGGDKAIHLWDVASKKETGKITAAQDVIDACWLGNAALTGGVGKEVVKWTLDGTATTIAAGESAVVAVAASADGHYVVASFMGGSVKVFDLMSAGAPKLLPRQSPGEVTSITTMPGDACAFFDTKYGILAWDMATGNLIGRVNGGTDATREIVAGAAGQVLVLDENAAVRVMEGFEEVCNLKTAGVPVGIAYVAAKNDIVAANPAGEIQVRHIQSPPIVGDFVRFRRFAITPDGGRAVGLSNPMTPYEFNFGVYDMKRLVKTGELKQLFTPPLGVYDRSVAISDDGSVAVVGTQKEAVFVDVAAGAVLKRWAGPAGEYGALRFSPDGKRLAAGQGGTGPASAAAGTSLTRVFDVESGKELAHTETQDMEVMGISWSPDGGRILSRTGEYWQLPHSGDQSAVVWDAATGEALHTFRLNGRAFVTAEFTRDGKYIVTVDQRGEIKVYDAVSYQSKWGVNHGSPIPGAAVSADGQKLLVLLNPERAILHEVGTGKVLAESREMSAHGVVPLPFFQGSQPMIWRNDMSRGRLETVEFPGVKGANR